MNAPAAWPPSSSSPLRHKIQPRTNRVTAISAAVTLSVLSLPAVAEPHFVLLAIPLALLQLNVTELVVIGALPIVPLEITAERFTAGWWAVLAYPRPYAAWLLWAASIRGPRGAKMRTI